MKTLDPLDLFVVASLCVRGKIRVHTLAIMALLMRRPWVTANLINRHAGASLSDTYGSLYYLENKGLAERRERNDDDGMRSYYEWNLTEEGKRVILSYEKIYRELYQLMQERW